MPDAGFHLRQARLRRGLTCRDVEQASNAIAAAKLNQDYSLPISRLSEIENHGAQPTIYRIYSLCVIYGINFTDVLNWLDLDLNQLPADQDLLRPKSVSYMTHLLPGPDEISPKQEVELPIRLDPGLNLRETTYLTRMIEAWGKVPLSLLSHLNLRDFRYGYMGLDDWTMDPLIPPGALLQIDMQRRQVESRQWRNEFERPIYFVELRDGYACAWCAMQDKNLILQPHPLSGCTPRTFPCPQQAEVLGQVVGVAKHLAAARKSARPTTAGSRTS